MEGKVCTHPARPEELARAALCQPGGQGASEVRRMVLPYPTQGVVQPYNQYVCMRGKGKGANGALGCSHGTAATGVELSVLQQH